MSSDLLDDWDENFLEQAIKIEEHYAAAVSSRNPPLTTTTSSTPLPQINRQPQPPPSQSAAGGNLDCCTPSHGSHGVHSRFSAGRSHQQSFGGQRSSYGFGGALAREDHEAGFSPPRELSQRFPEKPETSVDPAADDFVTTDWKGVGSCLKNKEDEKRKFDCLNISTDWTSAYHTSEDKSERKSVHFNGQLSDNERSKGADATKKGEDKGYFTVSELKHPANGSTTSAGYVNQQNLTKTIGIQTDPDVNYCSDVEEKLSFHHDLSRDLLAIWGISGKRGTRKNLVSKLFSTCSEDFSALLSYSGLSSEAKLKLLSIESSFDTKLDLDFHSFQSDASVKLYQLYKVLAKMGKEMVEMNILLDILVSICKTDNDLIVYRTLRIMRVVLQIAFKYEIRSYKRDLCVYSQLNDNTEKYNSELLKNEGIVDGMHISIDSCTSLVKTMQMIALKSNAECIQKEALSITILIVMKSDPISEREKFGLILSESFSKFLCKEVGMNVQKHALQLLFLLLNCPNLMLAFSNQHKTETNQADSSEGQTLDFILKGLSECILCGGKSVLELKVQRRAVIVLAFIASSGHAGFEILLKSVVPQGANFLELIIQILAMDMDVHSAGLDKSKELLSERILVMREALILLNRLASNASYSKTVLAVLTRSASSTSLIIDAANKLSRRSRECWKYDPASKIPVVEAETLDLACSIRARVLSFLGENIS